MKSQPAPPDPESPTASDEAVSPAAATPATVPELGRLREYVLLEKIVQGGMGAVYRAVHTRLDRIVALKTLPAERMSNPDAVARFTREMKAVGKLNHPNIVQATDAGEVGGTHFLVMEYVEGTELSVAAGRLGPLPIAAACEIARQAALGLAHAHQRGLIHRDVKPSNLLLSAGGQVKVLDLGLALLLSPFAEEGGSTVSGVVMGTFDYMAPEQAADAHAVTARADVYSLGCTLYHLLRGKAPFGGFPSGALKMRAHATEPVPPIRAARPEVSPALEAVLLRMLAKDPADRYAGAAEAAEALAPFAAGADLRGLAASLTGSAAVASAETLPPSSPARRRRRSAALGTAALLAAVGLAAVLWFLPRSGDGGTPTGPAKGEPEAEAGLPAPPLPQHQRPAAPADGFATLLDADAKAYETWLAQMRADGLRPASLQVRDSGDGPRFQAIAVRDSKPVAWEAPLDLDDAAADKQFAQFSERGYRNVCSTGYLDGSTVRFANLWAQDAGDGGWYNYRALTVEELTGKVDELQKEGYRPASINGYFDGQKVLFAAYFVPHNQARWEALAALPPLRLENAVPNRRARGFRPVSLGAFAGANGPRLPVVWLADASATAWELRVGLTAARYREEEDSLASHGYRPLALVGYAQMGKTLYAAVWVRDSFAELPLPRSGRFVPDLEPFDRAMVEFLRERNIPAGALAVVKDGRLVLSRGYGYADRERTKPLAEDAPFRLASLTKMMTAAAVRKLIRDGKLTRESKVFDLLALGPPPGKALDPRWKAVTVGHLLDHQGGWDVEEAKFDPMFRSVEISAALGKPGPATAAEVIRYMVGQPMQFDPGKKSFYSNFGYCLLGRVIEKVSGKPYLDYLRSDVLEPAGVKGVALGRTLPADRDPREPFYSDTHLARDVMRPESKDKVPDPDGGFCVETIDSHGGLTAPAADVARFLVAFALDGHPAGRHIPGGAAFGSLPGTFTMALKRPDGVGIVVLFNQRTDPSGLDYFKIEEVMNRAADAVKRWPAPGER
ncbi:MAG TPA: serine hydrolase [Gemmataceae bacterium]|nr:serine hydrolase [Gemmataceae bacterium]